MSVKAFVILVAIVAALCGAAYVMHHPGSMRSLGQAIHGQP